MHDTKDLLDQLDGLAFLRGLFGEIGNPDPAGEVRVLCPFHQDGSPSLTYNVVKNLFRCLACATEGAAPDLWAFIKQIPRHKAVEQLAELFGLEKQKLVAPAIYEAWHASLMYLSEIRQTFLHRKGVTDEMITQYRLGWDGDAQRITIPITDAKGRCVNVKKYDLMKLHDPKMKYTSLGGLGESRLWPAVAMDGEEIDLVEGEIKAIVHRARGFNACTATGGASTWRNDWNPKFQGKKLRIWMDVDGAGRQAARNRANQLCAYAAEIKDCLVPISVEEIPKAGIEDWYARGATREMALALIENTPVFVPDQELEDPAFADPNEYEVELGQASVAIYYHKKLSVPAVVSGKDIAPFVVPKELGVRCKRGAIDACQICPVSLTGGEQRWTIESDREELLELLGVHRDKQQTKLRNLIGIPQGMGGCRAHELIATESQNVEEIRLVPQLDVKQGGAAGGVGGTPTGGEQVVAKAYYVGHGIESNTPYQVHGRVAADPEDQHATLIVKDATPNVDSLTTFKPSSEEMDALRLFQPTEWTVAGLDSKLDDLYSDLEGNITHIYHRRAMHLLMDLVWHSVLYIPLNGEPKKGWLDCLVIGDSGQGKSETFMRLLGHYGLGEWVDMKGASVAGLKGGLSEEANRWWVKWGSIPLNDRRMVILDEVKGCAPEVLQALTSMRSSGLAEVQKIERRRAWARTRLLWISNPRSDRKVETYNYGVSAIKELFGSLEDVRRFDAALVVASNEVSAKQIATGERGDRVDARHSAELCRRLILWCWSRGVSDVVVQPEAFEAALEHATRQGKSYSSGIPLVEPADHRLKLLRLAAALAGRTYSVEVLDGTSGQLVVRPCHVEYVARFLDQIYESRFMGYDEFSKLKTHEETLPDPAYVRKLLLALPYCKETLLGFSRSNEIRQSDLIDWCELEKDDARKTMSALVRANALTRKGNSYFKSGAFIELLRLVLRDIESGVETPRELSREY